MTTLTRPRTQPHIECDTARYHPLKPMAVRHSLSGHPLLERGSLLQLATRMQSPGKVNYISGKATPGADFTSLLGTHGTGRSLAETLERIEEPGAWVGFYRIESDPIYKTLVDECLDSVLPFVAPHDPGMFGRRGWIFFSSPDAVTPYHIDTENNFLLQIHGEKTLCVWDPYDRSVLPDRAIETYLAQGTLDAVQYRDDLQDQAFTFEMTPGAGAYMPCTAPHWAKTHSEDYSITLAVTYFTQATERRARTYQANALLRRAKLSPRPVGESPFADALKSRLYEKYLAGKKKWRGSAENT